MKCLLVLSLFVLMLLPLGNSALADVDCTTLHDVWLRLPNGTTAPAIHFTVLGKQSVPGTLDIFENCTEQSCTGQCAGKPLQHFDFEFNLDAGEWRIFLPLDPRPPDCTWFCFRWRIDQCDPHDSCYHVKDHPATEDGAKEKNIKALPVTSIKK